MLYIKIALVLLLLMAAFAWWLIDNDCTVDELRARYRRPGSRFASVDGMKVHYSDEGQGPALVLLHGTSSSLHTWDQWSALLNDRYRIIRLDLPGHGLTGPHPNGRYGLEDYVHFLRHFLDTIGIDRFYLAGNSLGGTIAWAYATCYPRQVERLVLIGAGGFAMQDVPARFKLAHSRSGRLLLRWVTPRSLVRSSLRELVYHPSLVTEEMVDRIRDLQLREGNRQAFIDRVHAYFPDWRERLRDLEVPTLLLWGEADPVYPLQVAADSFARYLPQARLHVVERAAHLPMEERPYVTAAIVDQFLAAAVSSSATTRTEPVRTAAETNFSGSWRYAHSLPSHNS